MSALLVTLVLAGFDPSLEKALQRALTRSPAKVELASWDAPRCKGTNFLPAPFERSGRVAVRVRGTACEAWGWAEVRVIVPVATLSRDVKANESLDGAWVTTDQEATVATLADVPVGASASRSLRKGAKLSATDFRMGPRPGTAVTVRVMLGQLSLEQSGTVSPCSGLETCATLPSGKRVAGVFTEGVLVVGTP
jgi:hypothetical protein